eukprot:TRINITY_DN12972_c0_g3_i1.p1 TRINITY_DN12972_c0_g3~~TRINITY_DN12972_c0_g3_i1.p1  ORF type:complete len:355 (+),score=77.96 TRINITY_DN12972_c0_g3_i1:117-1181(+)
MAQKPAVTVLGSADPELDRLVVTDYASVLRSTSAELIDALFDSLTAAAEAEQIQALQQGDSSVKRNRRETYLESSIKQEWMGRLRAFVSRRRQDLAALTFEALYSALAMQHYLELDAVDFDLEPEKRRLSDTYTDGLNDQFLMDASRGRFTILGEVFHYAESASTGELESDFVSRIVAALCASTPPALLALVSTVMSQSGLAALERASLCTIAVSRGTQCVDYALKLDPNEPGGVIVALQVRRNGFRQYLHSGNAGSDGEELDAAEPCCCEKQSWLRKAATVSISPSGIVDVLDFEELVSIYADGQLLPSANFFHAPPKKAARRETAKGLRRFRCSVGGCPKRFCQRLCTMREA